MKSGKSKIKSKIKPVRSALSPDKIYCAKKWRLLDTGFNHPFMNMAMDEALVHLIKPNDPPILRFYDWSTPAISAGYSQKIKDILDISLYRAEGKSIVRRPTGGGIVFHGTDVTYSVILPETFDMDLKDTHILIQSWIKKGLDTLGLNVSQHDKAVKGVPMYCSIQPNFGDIMIKGKKAGGLAGRRIRQKILFQGYLNIEKSSISKEDVRRAIIDNWCAKTEKGCINDKEEELAGVLYENKYSKDEWNLAGI